MQVVSSIRIILPHSRRVERIFKGNLRRKRLDPLSTEVLSGSELDRRDGRRSTSLTRLSWKWNRNLPGRSEGIREGAAAKRSSERRFTGACFFRLSRFRKNGG